MLTVRIHSHNEIRLYISNSSLKGAAVTPVDFVLDQTTRFTVAFGLYQTGGLISRCVIDKYKFEPVLTTVTDKLRQKGGERSGLIKHRHYYG
tara:strand:- start:157 stop:432 length:276 start_codon:yes stop_codon:yes gene_type:complete